MRVAVTGPAISLICLRKFDFFHFLLCLLQLPIALATKACNFCSFLGFTAYLPFLLVLNLRRSVWMIDSSWGRTFINCSQRVEMSCLYTMFLLARDPIITPLGMMCNGCPTTSIVRSSVFSDMLCQASLRVDVQSPMKSRTARHQWQIAVILETVHFNGNPSTTLVIYNNV